VRERIDLEAARSVAAAGGNARGSRGPGFRMNVTKSSASSYTFSRKELDDALRDPNQLTYLGIIGMPPGGGVRMEAAPSGSLAQKLGLQAGDIIMKINGQPVASSGVLARFLGDQRRDPEGQPDPPGFIFHSALAGRLALPRLIQNRLRASPGPLPSQGRPLSS
jgi:hypothetical protein